jgi:hypothetical protein
MSEEDNLLNILYELYMSNIKYGDFNSYHEGYAILLEEVDELWYEIKNNKIDGFEDRIKNEAKQVSAMALKLMNYVDTNKGVKKE